MKHKITCVLLILFLSSSSIIAQNYEIEIDGVKQSIELNKATTITLKDGKKISVKVNQKEHVKFTSKLFSFTHKNKHKATTSPIDKGINQTMIITPLGTGIIVQEYTAMNPGNLIDIMINELTKEEVEYGFKLKTTKTTKKINGVLLKGKTATSTYQKTKWVRDVYVCGGKDKGLVIVTFIEKENYSQDQPLIDAFWKTLKIAL